jgi:carbonic anhydrase
MSCHRSRGPVRPRLAASAALALVLALPGSTALAEEAHWSYEGETGPEHWGELAPEWEACGSGREQSPVDVPGDAPVRADDVEWGYAPSVLTVLDTGHSVQVVPAEGSTAAIDGVAYELRQSHFHSPSEHTLEGEHTAMELHLVHVDESGGLAVIGVMLVEGTAQATIEAILDHLPATVGETVTVEGVTIDPTDLLPADRSYVAYPGSLTTPPCSEGVRWHVLVEPVELSVEQLEAFRAVHDGTNRPVQPLNDRAFEAAAD